MNLRIVLIFFTFILLCFGQASGCLLKNITCGEIRVASGFRFINECPVKSVVEIQDSNKTSIAHFNSIKNLSELSPEVVKIDRDSIITKSCQDLTVKCIITKEFLEEKSVCFKVTGNPDPDPDRSWNPKHIAAFIICAVLGIAVITLCGWFVRWKINQIKKQESEAVATFLKHVVICSCLSKADSPETRTQNESRVQLVRKTEVENQFNNNISEDTNTPNITSHSHHRPMKRNLRDDPGGENGTETRNIIREADGGQTAGNQKAERQLLLSDQRVVNTGLDMTGGAGALVNKAGFDHVSRCSGAPVIDVESEHKEEPK